MKRSVAILTAALTLSLTACGNTGGNSSAVENSNPQSSINSVSSENSSEPAAERSSQNSSATAPDDNESGSVLISYFTAAENSGVDAVALASYSMVNGKPVGRLRAIADMIQAETGGELSLFAHRWFTRRTAESLLITLPMSAASGRASRAYEPHRRSRKIRHDICRLSSRKL